MNNETTNEKFIIYLSSFITKAPEFLRVKRQFLPIHPGLAGAKVRRRIEGAKVLFAKVLKKQVKRGHFQNKICGEICQREYFMPSVNSRLNSSATTVEKLAGYLHLLEKRINMKGRDLKIDF